MAEKRLSNRDMLEVIYRWVEEQKAKEKSTPFDGSKNVPVVPGPVAGNWQSEPPPNFVYDDKEPPEGYIWIYHTGTGERIALKACIGPIGG